MKFIFLFLLSLCFFSEVRGQGAFDPNCYFPTFGNGIDTIYGSRNGQALGADLRSVARSPADSDGVVIMHGLPPQIPFLSVVKGGDTFDLHSLTKQTPKERFGIDIGAYDYVKFGHFRDTKHIDMLVGEYDVTLYWADENGDYDSSRKTLLATSFKGDFGGGTGQLLTPPYVANLSSDTVLDVVNTIGVNWSVASGKPDSTWLALWRGGQHLYDQGAIAYQDSVLFIDTLGGENIKSLRLFTFTGDFRGVGREDLIAVDDSNSWLYYKNDLPFSMQKFYDAIRFDTLLSAYENRPNGYIVSRNTGGSLLYNYKIFAKPHWDMSEDLFSDIPLSNDPMGKNQKIVFFRGGADFGLSRLTLASATDSIYTPYHYDGSFDVPWGLGGVGWQSPIAGDLTGTGNKVLYCAGGSDFKDMKFFYVLGKAFDDKVDMYYEFSTHFFGSSIGGSSVIKANEDTFEDFLIATPSVLDQKDLDRGWEDVGTVHLVKGSDKIPVTLNPKYAVEEIKHLRQTEMYAFPNPFEQKTVLTFENCSRGVMYMDVVNTLGVSVLRETLPDVNGYQQYLADLSTLPAGAYYIRLVCPADGWSATASVIKTGAAQAPWKLDLHSLVK